MSYFADHPWRQSIGRPVLICLLIWQALAQLVIWPRPFLLYAISLAIILWLARKLGVIERGWVKEAACWFGQTVLGLASASMSPSRSNDDNVVPLRRHLWR